MTAKIIPFDRAAARLERSAAAISHGTRPARQKVKMKADGRAVEAGLNDLMANLSWPEIIGFASAADRWDAGRADEAKVADREAARAAVFALDRRAHSGRTEEIARRYRAFLRTANRFARAALRSVYRGRQQRVIQSIRQQTIASLLLPAAVEEVCEAFARAEAHTRERVLADIDRFVGDRGSDRCAERECSDARAIVCALVTAGGAHLAFEQLCHLRKLVSVLGLGLDV